MTEKRFEYTFEGIEDTLEINEENKYISCNKDGFQDLCELLNELHEENVELKKEIKNLGTTHAEEINKIEDEFYEEILKMEKKNEQLKQLLNHADDLIQSHLSKHFIRQWRNFKTGHKEYNDFWKEKLKKHKELKEDVK